MQRLIWLLFVMIIASCSRNDDHINLEPVKPPEPKPGRNIILMIGDGMGLTQITGAKTVNGGKLNMFRCQTIGLQTTHCADKYVTDSGAASTAMACGKKTNYYYIGVDTAGNTLTNIIEMLEVKGYSTGLISTSEITHATPAAFYAHQMDRFNYEAIAMQLITKGVDFFLGGGLRRFNQRTDGLNLVDSLLAQNYQVVNDLGALSGDQKAAVFISNEHPVPYLEGRGDVLPNSIAVAAGMLKQNKNGFFMMVEGAQIDWAGEENDQAYLMAEMLDFDRAVGEALDFAEADGNTLVIITGDHETGGYALTDGSISGNTVQGQFVTWLHTGAMVPVFAYGPGEEAFAGVYDNTDIFSKMLKYYGITP